MQRKTLVLFSTFLLSLAGIFFLAQPAFAKGETYMYSGTGSNADALGGTQITASGGAYKSDTIFYKVSSPSVKIPHEPSIEGYSVYYVAQSINLKDAASSFPRCRVTPAIISMKNEGSRVALLTTASSDANCGNLSNITPDSDSLVLSSDLEILANATVKAERDAQAITASVNGGYSSALSPLLTGVRDKYYLSLGANAPCSSQGCSDTTWNNNLGECWATARSQAADSARYTRPPAVFDSETSTKENFARCLQAKINNVISAPLIYSLLTTTTASSVNTAGDTAGQSIRDAQAAAAAAAAGSIKEPGTCDIKGIGWIVCPVINFLADIADSAYSFLSTTFLETKAGIFDSDSGTYATWSQVRNLSNIVFVIVFLIIIFSQMTSLGISNYGVKKMLPRLVIAAILVNISYFICQIAVDISNILGYSITSIFHAVIADPKSTLDVSSSGVSNGTGFAGFIGGIFATGIAIGVVYLMIGTLIPVLLAAVVALVMILFILVARQALIVILVILSPLAFVAFLLPNTEQLFKRWRKMFVAMLMLFPIVAVVYGGSTVASAVITHAFSGPSDKPEVWGQLIGAAVGVLPLFVVPGLLKKSLDSVGGIGAKINGLGGKLSGAASKKGSQAYENSRLGQYKKFRQGEGDRKRAKIQSGTFEGRGGRFRPANLMSNINSRINQSPRSGKFGDRATAQGAALESAEDAELVKNATSRLEYFKQSNGNPLSQDQMLQIAKGEHLTENGKSTGRIIADKKTFDTYTRQAAIQKAGAIATVEEAHALIAASSNPDVDVAERKILSDTIAKSGIIAKAPYLGGPTLGAIQQGTAVIDGPGGQALAAIAKGKINDESLANADTFALQTLYNAANGTVAGSSERLALKAAHAAFMRNPLLSGKVAENTPRYKALQDIATL